MTEQQHETPAKNRPGLIRKVAIPKNASIEEYMELMGLEYRGENGARTARAVTQHEMRDISEQEKLIGKAIKEARRERNLPREYIAKFFNITEQTFGRYERSEHTLTLAMFINICEILGCMPIELMGGATPQLWGKDENDTAKKLALTQMIGQLPQDKLDMIFTVVSSVAKNND